MKFFLKKFCVAVLAGCGDDKCEKFGKCQIKGFQPVCCNNKCMCAQTPKKFDSKAKTKLCKKCNDPKSTVCQAATASEFNCWLVLVL